MRVKARTIFVDACCTIISINISKYSNVNCTLNILFKIHLITGKARKVVYFLYSAQSIIYTTVFVYIECELKYQIFLSAVQVSIVTTA